MRNFNQRIAIEIGTAVLVHVITNLIIAIIHH